VGFGSNVGKRRENIAAAVDAAGRIDKTRVKRVSPLYETEPVGFMDQGWFINGVFEAETGLSPRKLLEGLLKIELVLGRVRSVKDGPRIIDLDVLFFGDEIIDAPGLVVPHPLLHRRGFVLWPLADLAPDLVHPVLKKSVRELLSELPPGEEVRGGEPF
jgi:2-amino-4-hydroxy-6-hydroxymethyldihydropteridine diphosphokinase